MTGGHGACVVAVDSFAEQKECQGKMVGVVPIMQKYTYCSYIDHFVRHVTVLSLMLLVVYGHERSVFCPRRFKCTEETVGPKAVQDAVVKRGIHKRACRKSIPSHPLCSPSL
jgi:hypothetical protein